VALAVFGHDASQGAPGVQGNAFFFNVFRRESLLSVEGRESRWNLSLRCGFFDVAGHEPSSAEAYGT
jgi:hypothetical protein